MKKTFAKIFASQVLGSIGILLLIPTIAVAGGLFYIDSATGFAGFGNTTPQAQVDVSGTIYSRLVTVSSSTVDWNQGNVQEMTLSSNPTLTFSNGHAGGQYTLILQQDGTGGRTVTWPASVEWSGGTVPTLTTNASGTDMVKFVYDGSRYLGTFTLNYFATVNVNYLIVAGGGGGGSQNGGGGGGGGALTGTEPITSGIAYTVTVGGGGNGGATGGGHSGSQGGNSSVNFDSGTVIAEGGGYGGSATGGGNGGSGGGASNDTGTGGTGVSGQGNSGGNGHSGAGTNDEAGGGGGESGAGGNGNGSTQVGGAGGAGLSSSISGSSVTYACGGGGSVDARTSGGTAGAAGCASAGAGGYGGPGASASANSGGAGGGGGYDNGSNDAGGYGGSGVVTISAPTSLGITATGGTHTTSGGYDIWTFTSSGTWTPTF